MVMGLVDGLTRRSTSGLPPCFSAVPPEPCRRDRRRRRERRLLDAFSLEAQLAGSVAPAARPARGGGLQINTGPALGADASGKSRSTDFSSASSTASDGMRVGLTFATGASSAGAQLPSTPSLHAAVPDAWQPHPMDPLRFVKAEIRQLLLQRGALSIAQLPEEYLKCFADAPPLEVTAVHPGSAAGPAVALENPAPAFLREHLTDVVEVRGVPRASTRLSPPASRFSSARHAPSKRQW